MRTDRSAALAFGGLASMTAAIGIGRFVYTPILPAMLGALGWSKSDAGLVASANLLGYFIGALLAGRPFVIARPRPCRRTWPPSSAFASSAVSPAPLRSYARPPSFWSDCQLQDADRCPPFS